MNGRPRNFADFHASQLMIQGVLFNCSARIERTKEGFYEPMGNCTEQGLIRYLQNVSVPVQDVIRLKEERILQTIPFNSRRKRACTAVQVPGQNGTVRVFLTGAPEIVIEHCTSYIDQEGHTVALSAEKREQIIGQVVSNTFAKRAYRTLMIASADLTMEEYERLRLDNNLFKSEADREVLERNLTIVGIYAL